MSTSTITWSLICKLASGHRIFANTLDGALAIADNSGSTPDRTEDGILWLNTAETVQIAARYVNIPVTVDRRSSGEDRDSHVGVELADVQQLFTMGYKNFDFTAEAQKLANTWRTVLAIADVAG